MPINCNTWQYLLVDCNYSGQDGPRRSGNQGEQVPLVSFEGQGTEPCSYYLGHPSCHVGDVMSISFQNRLPSQDGEPTKPNVVLARLELLLCESCFGEVCINCKSESASAAPGLALNPVGLRTGAVAARISLAEEATMSGDLRSNSER